MTTSMNIKITVCSLSIKFVDVTKGFTKTHKLICLSQKYMFVVVFLAPDKLNCTFIQI